MQRSRAQRQEDATGIKAKGLGHHLLDILHHDPNCAYHFRLILTLDKGLSTERKIKFQCLSDSELSHLIDNAVSVQKPPKREQEVKI